MYHNLSDFLNELDRELSALEQPERVAFSVWCTKRLLDKFGLALRNRLGESYDAIVITLWQVWKETLDGGYLETARLEAARNGCRDASWDQDDLSEADEEADNGAIELLGCLRRTFDMCLTNQTAFAVQAAECVINCVDYHLNMVLGVESPLEHPEMTVEFQRQMSVVSWLAREGNRLSQEFLQI